jgi:hypothetical protein
VTAIDEKSGAFRAEPTKEQWLAMAPMIGELNQIIQELESKLPEETKLGERIRASLAHWINDSFKTNISESPQIDPFTQLID